VERAEETGISPIATLSDPSGHHYFFSRNMPRAVNDATQILFLQDEDMILSGEHIEWIVWNDSDINHGNVISVQTHWNGIVWLHGTYATEEERVHYEQIAIDIQLRRFRAAMASLAETDGLLFYLSSGSTVRSNLSSDQRTPDFFLSQSVYFISQSIYFIAGTDVRVEASHQFRNIFAGWAVPDDGAMHLAFANEIVDAFSAHYTAVRTAYLWDFGSIIVAALLVLVLLVILFLGAGRRRKEDGVHFALVDRPYLDLSFVAVFIWIVVVGFNAVSLVQTIDRHGNFFTVFVFILLSLAMTSILIPALLWLLSFAKRLKAGRFWRHTLIFAVINWVLSIIIRFFKAIWKGFPLGSRLIIRPISHANRIKMLESGAKQIADGNFDVRIDVGGGELGNIAESINNISAGIHKAVGERMKSERLKTELITNVSHDIRTPLTSIITYTDLLKQEGLDSEKAPEYLEVLVQKSGRLKTLTDELFEAAKAATGNIEVNLIPLDFVALMNQVLGELDETIKKSGLDLRVSLPEKMFILADGKLMWRVMENLLSNVFKYSLPGSRVYLHAQQTGAVACIELKNISATELNVDPHELTERFKRGDDSRTDGGTGLGLSIVQSFVTAQGGEFNVSIDGDLFKATVLIPPVGF